VVSSTLPYPPLSPWWAKEDAMRARKVQQRDLFDDHSSAPEPALPPEVLKEALQILTGWLHSLSKAMVQGSGDEQDRR
jgi:hypothetical protein